MIKLSERRPGASSALFLTCRPYVEHVVPQPAATTSGSASWRVVAVLGAMALLLLVAAGSTEAQRAAGHTMRTVASTDALQLTTPRYGMGIVKSKDGKIYAIGGGSGRNSLDSVDMLDTAADAPQWIRLPARLYNARYALAAAIAPDGKIYAIGGFTDNYQILDTVEVYDPASPSPQWIRLPEKLHAARKGCAAVTGLDGKIYVIGGGGVSGPLDSVEVLDPTAAKPQWTLLSASLNIARQDFAAVTGLDGKIYVIGGYGDRGKALDTVEVLDPAASHWTELPCTLPETRYGLAAVIGADGKIYAIGGRLGANARMKANDAGQTLASATTGTRDTAATYERRTVRKARDARPLERNFSLDVITVYDPSAMHPHWVDLPTPLTAPRERPGVVLGSDGKLLVIGGVDPNTHALASIEVYDPAPPPTPQIATSH